MDTIVASIAVVAFLLLLVPAACLPLFGGEARDADPAGRPDQLDRRSHPTPLGEPRARDERIAA